MIKVVKKYSYKVPFLLSVLSPCSIISPLHCQARPRESSRSAVACLIIMFLYNDGDDFDFYGDVKDVFEL